MRVVGSANKGYLDRDGLLWAMNRLRNATDRVVSRTLQNWYDPALRQVKKHTRSEVRFDERTATAQFDVLNNEGVLGVKQILDDGDVRRSMCEVAYQCPLRVSICTGSQVDIAKQADGYFSKAA